MRIKKISVVITVALVIVVGLLIADYLSDKRHSSINHKSNVEITVLAGAVPSDIKLRVEYLDSKQSMILDGFSADVFPNGDIIYVGNDLSLRKISRDGDEVELLAKQEANAQVFLNQNGTMAVYTKPGDWQGGDIPETNGIAVYSFDDGQEKILLMEKNTTILHFGWLDNRIIVNYPSRENYELFLLDLDGQITGIKTDNVLPQSSRMASKDPNSRYIAYESIKGDIIIVDLKTGFDTRISNAKDPQWTKEGLSFKQDGRQKVFKLK